MKCAKSSSAPAARQARWSRFPGWRTTSTSSRSKRSHTYPSKDHAMDQQIRTPANLDRLNEFMDRNGLAALVARSGQNFTYLTGMAFPGTLQRMLDLTDSPR